MKERLFNQPSTSLGGSIDQMNDTDVDTLLMLMLMLITLSRFIASSSTNHRPPIEQQVEHNQIYDFIDIVRHRRRRRRHRHRHIILSNFFANDLHSSRHFRHGVFAKDSSRHFHLHSPFMMSAVSCRQKVAKRHDIRHDGDMSATCRHHVGYVLRGVSGKIWRED